MKKKIITCMLSAVMVLSLMASAVSAETSSSKELTVYTPWEDDYATYVFNSFEEDTGIHVNYIRLGAGEMLTRVEAEKENPQATVMFGGGSSYYISATQKGLLEPYQSSELSSTPDAYLDPDGYWNPVNVGIICFACNTEWFEDNGYDYPTSWEDLLDPKYEGEIIMAHPATSGTAYNVLATILQLMENDDDAWDYMAALNKNISQYTKSGTAAPNAVAMGESAIALTFSHDGLMPAVQGYPVEISFPSEGTGYEIGATAIIKGGKEEEMENAKLFIDWITSARGQSTYAEMGYPLVPTNVKAEVSDGLVTLDQVNVIDFDPVWAGEVKEEYCAIFEEKIANAPTE